ncbi:MAG: aspartate aminotransferase family protein [Acidobacteriia bacterium]|nr:aspartate aminotransferase family protein [Terriglobia bacterium]
MTSTRSAVQTLDQEFVFPTYARAPVVFVRGEGVFLFDENGKQYLDFLSGIAVNALGHNHPRIVSTITDQARKILHVCNLYHNEYQAALAQTLCRLSGLDSVFFCNSGTEAVEAALKAARIRAYRNSNGQANPKVEVVALLDSFHGRTCGALSLTGQEKYRKPFEPLIPGVHFIPRNDIDALHAAVTDKTCAVILEPIQGESGIQVLDAAFLKAARAACDDHNAMLVFDEVQCGLGRTGKFFAFQHTDVQPDLVAVAKPLGLGIPMGALLGVKKVREDLALGTHGSTFGGGPLACRVSLEFFQIMEEQGLLEKVASQGQYFSGRLAELRARHPAVQEIRGKGLMIGMQLSSSGKEIVRQMLDRGYVINCANETVLRFLPPYLIEREHIDRLIDALDQVLPH